MSIVAAVMVVTAFYSIVAGVVVGIALACVIFIVHMSRPIVRRRHSGEYMSSKRIRPAEDVSVLRASGARRMVFELQGVLFFGNADDLSHEILDLLAGSDAVLLDFKGISDIDVSGAQVLRSVIQKARSQGKRVLFCSVLEPLAGVIGTSVGTNGTSEPQVFADRDSALEFMEEEALRSGETKRGYLDLLPLEQHNFLEGVDAIELAIVAGYLSRREFIVGEVICREGDDADRMWLLVKGSVSVRLRVNNQSTGLRIASLARGTIVGELALIEHGKRSATVVADETVTCYELQRDGYERIFRERPQIANKLLINLARELARRVRRTSDELREATS
jgi:anti-anti-sigma regulatory factor